MSNLAIFVEDDRLLQALIKAPIELEKEVGSEIETIIQLIARDARVFAPKAFSLLANSINAFMVGPVEGVVAPAQDYARAVEEGSDPHFPPVQNIEDWAKVVGIDPVDGESLRDVAFKIARSIAVTGVPAQPYMEPALEKNHYEAQQRVSAGIDRALGGTA